MDPSDCPEGVKNHIRDEKILDLVVDEIIVFALNIKALIHRKYHDQCINHAPYSKSLAFRLYLNVNLCRYLKKRLLIAVSELSTHKLCSNKGNKIQKFESVDRGLPLHQKLGPYIFSRII